ncbi:MAG: hypothetical protein WCV90_03015 [Candidatus Woesearchaeota archaeon]|jgi:hypothetical protein
MKGYYLVILLILTLFFLGCSKSGESVVGNAVYQTLSSPERMEFEQCWQDKCTGLMKVDQTTCAQTCYDQAKSR